MQELRFQGTLVGLVLELIAWFILAVILSYLDSAGKIKHSWISSAFPVILSVLLMGIFTFNFTYGEEETEHPVTISDVTGK